MYKVALVTLCLNQPYWQYLKPMVESARKFLLKGHQVDFITLSDMPESMNDFGIKIIPTAPAVWPLPTLMRYHLMLREEELLKQYDYVFFCDADMEFVSPVGDEILGESLTAAQHPMYALSKRFVPPYEPNPESASYIPRPGRIVGKGDKRRFEPLYLAGGFQGGRTDVWIEAMKVMRSMINTDTTNIGYTPIWNDETAWNAYLFNNQTDKGVIKSDIVVLSPSYVYPDSMNSAYYKPIWGRNYVPKIITITKKHTLSKQAGLETRQNLN